MENSNSMRICIVGRVSVLVCVACGPGEPAVSSDASAGSAWFSRVTDAGPVVTDSFLSAGGSWSDYDLDGDLDLLVNGGGRNRLYRNAGGGHFAAVTTGALVTDSAFTLNGVWADYDNDGYTDVYISQSAFGRDPWVNVLFHNDGPPAFDFTPIDIGEGATLTSTASWVDFDNDGDVDLYAPVRGGPDLLYRNDGGSEFTPLDGLAFMTQNSQMDLIDYWIDYDGDGDQDLYKVFRRGQNQLFENLLTEADRAASFREVTESTLIDDGEVRDIASAWGDYDNDGDFDVFLSVLDGPNRLYRNERGQFSRVASSALVADTLGAVFGVWGDYDNDGDLDLFAPRDVAKIYRNDGGGRFAPLTRLTDGDGVINMLNPQAGHWGDYDNDGDLDLVLANFADPPDPRRGAPQPDMLIQNNRGSEKNWMMVQLEGVESNRSGIGALIEAKAYVGGQSFWQMRTVAGGPTGNNFQADMKAHFGLGDAQMVDSLRITWPSGIVQMLTDVPSNQVVRVTETKQ